MVASVIWADGVGAQTTPMGPTRQDRPVKAVYGEGSDRATVHRIDATGDVLGVSSLRGSYWQREGDIQEVEAIPHAESVRLIGDDPIEVLAAEVVIYDNSTVAGYWYHPGAGYEMLDYGTTTAGGTVTKFTFAYVTTLTNPGNVYVRFYSGTDSSTCPGTFLAGWVFSGLMGSGTGAAQVFMYDLTISVEEQFDLGAGAFGYSYQFSNSDTGAYVAGGGQGNEDAFWRDCDPDLYWFDGTPWAGFYMRGYAAQGGGGPGETCGDPLVISQLGFSDIGNTCDYLNDYDRCASGGSGEVVYEFTPTENTDVRISLCGSSYDSVLYVLEGDCAGTEIACNDDYCDLQSELPSVLLTGGTTYYIVVDGWGGACGDYALLVEENIPCDVNCPPNASPEPESCGANVNGGCESGLQAFTPIVIGDTVCGTVWANDGVRDMDWYRVYVPDVFGTGKAQLTWTVESEFPSAASIVTNGCGWWQVLARGYGGDCQGTEISACVAADAPYVLCVAPGTESGGIYDGIACGGINDYVARVDYRQCPSPEIRIEPEWVEFDCDPCGAQANGAGAEIPDSVTAANAERGREKLIRGNQINQDWARGGCRAKVVVNLVEPMGLRDGVRGKPPRKGRGRRLAAWQSLRDRVAGVQAPVLFSLQADELDLAHRFENQAGFSGWVTKKGLAKLRADPAVESIEPVFELQAHLAQGIPLMSADTVRAEYNGQGLAIAICDTGIDYNHERLGNGGFPNTKVLGGYDFGDDDADPIPNTQSHGTSCAGIAAGDLGTVGDYIGGVAYNAKLYALKISDGTGGSATSDAMIAAWDWCVTHQWDDPCNPIMVISTSFGGGQYFGACDSASPGMTTAAGDAALAGITVFASSGNDGYCDSMGWPACIDNVISVGAVYDADFGLYQPCVSAESCADKLASTGCSTGYYAIDETAADMVTSYSDTASFLDMLAPSNRGYTLAIGGYTSSFGGTSAACPYAAGAAACLQSAALAVTREYLSAAEVRSTLIATGDGITDGKVAITKPRVNLAQALSMWDCDGEVFVIYNDGNAVLDIAAVNGPGWADVGPAAPFSIEAGARRRMCVQMGCNDCGVGDLARQVQIYSNDLDESPYPSGVIISVDCPHCGPAGNLDGDCDADLADFFILAEHWGQSDCAISDWCIGADITRDEAVDLGDLAPFVEDWLVGVLP